MASPAITRAALAAVLVVLTYAIWKASRREGFVSEKAIEVTQAASKVFAAGGESTSFSALKKALPDVDVVEYTDLRDLYRAKSLTPERVDRVLAESGR
jgi:hypothetical protein